MLDAHYYLCTFSEINRQEKFFVSRSNKYYYYYIFLQHVAPLLRSSEIIHPDRRLFALRSDEGLFHNILHYFISQIMTVQLRSIFQNLKAFLCPQVCKHWWNRVSFGERSFVPCPTGFPPCELPGVFCFWKAVRWSCASADVSRCLKPRLSSTRWTAERER